MCHLLLLLAHSPKLASNCELASVSLELPYSQDLASWARAKISRGLVIPMLYRSISLFTESAVRQYCKSVENDSNLALLVKSFSIASSATPQNVSCDHHDFLLGIHHVLKCMSSLTNLSIRLVEKPPYQQRHWYALSFFYYSRPII